jgi:tetratricopeptide (TPR) repeat protein
MLAALGEYHLWQDQVEVAESYLQRARARWTEAEHVLGRASCLEALGTVEMKKDDPGKARELVTQARDLFATVGRERGVVLMNRRIGETYRHEGDYAKALGFLEHAYRWFEGDGDAYQRVRCGRSLALTLEGLSRAADAQQLLTDLVNLAESIGAHTDARELSRLAGPVTAGA